MGSTVTETAGVTTDVANDPTVGDNSPEFPVFCTMCGEQLRCKTCDEPAYESPAEDLKTRGPSAGSADQPGSHRR